MSTNISLHRFKSGIGMIGLAAVTEKLIYVSLPGEQVSSMKARIMKLFPDGRFVDSDRCCRRGQKQIIEFLSGKRAVFDLPYELTGTPFQKKALRSVARIPLGRTRTYGDIAKSIGHPGSARAVGSANAGNKLPLIVPCHRVVASNGLGGYYGGLKLKAKLLRLEKEYSSE